MSSTMAVSRIHACPKRMTGIEQGISRTTPRADLRRHSWRPIQQLLTYDIENDPTFEEEVPRTVREIEIEDPCAFLQCFTLDPSVGQRISPNRRRKMNFADFTKDLVEPYILEEITRQMQDAQRLLLNVAEEHQRAFEIEIVETATDWMEYQRKKFHRASISDLRIRKRVAALEQAAAQVYSIDTENDVVMNASHALPLAIESPPHYATEVAACMINETYQPWLNQIGRQFIA